MPPDIFKTFVFSEHNCVNYFLMYLIFFRSTNLLHYCIHYSLSRYDLLFSYSFFQSLLSIWATGLLITHPILDIWQNFEYGLRERKIFVYMYIQYICIYNTSKNKILGNNELF